MEELYVLPYGQMSLWGILNCPTWFSHNIDWMVLLPFSMPKVKSDKRIGPHNMDIFSVLIGSLLGDASAERHGNGVRFCFQQEYSHNAYLLWLHKYISELGYCNPSIPRILTRMGINGSVRQICRFKTFTYASFGWLVDSFYVTIDDVRTKIVPALVEEYLTPLALAVWIMDDGGATAYGLKIATNSFTRIECDMLCDILNRKYELEAKTGSAGAHDQYIIYIPSRSMLKLATIVGPHMHPSMYYKLGKHLSSQ